MKRELMAVAISAMFFAGCASVPAARNGKRSPAAVAVSAIVPPGEDEPAIAPTTPVARVGTAGKAGGVDPADGAGNTDFGGISGAGSRSPVVEAGRMHGSFASRRSPEIKNLAFEPGS